MVNYRLSIRPAIEPVNSHNKLAYARQGVNLRGRTVNQWRFTVWWLPLGCANLRFELGRLETSNNREISKAVGQVHGALSWHDSCPNKRCRVELEIERK